MFLTFHSNLGRVEQDQETKFLGAPVAAWVAMGVGGVIAIIDSLFFTSWWTLNFIATLAHEIGHAAVATFFGAPSFPAISLHGHAAAFYKGPFLLLTLSIWAFLGYLSYEYRQKYPKASRTLLVVAILYPLFAFTGLWKLLHLVSGHGGEIAFAGICFFRAWTGGYTHSPAERIAYATCGWYCTVSNLAFHGKLMTSKAFLALYRTNGSFNLKNDYLRVAEDMLDCRVQTVAFFMLLVNVLVMPALVVWAVRRWNRA